MVLNNCAEADRYNVRDYYIGVGFDMLDGDGYRQCRMPDLDDFKSFIFWNKQKCRVKKTYEFDWTFRSKYEIKRVACLENREWPEPPFKMYSYLQKNMVVSVGDRYPFKFMSHVNYKFRDNLYTNKHPAPFEPREYPAPVTRHYHSEGPQFQSGGNTGSDGRRHNNGGDQLDLSFGLLSASLLAVVAARV